MTVLAETRRELVTLSQLEKKPHLGSGDLQEGSHYELVRASFGQSDDVCGNFNRAHVVLRCPKTKRFFVIFPTITDGPGADDGTYAWKGLSCASITRDE